MYNLTQNITSLSTSNIAKKINPTLSWFKHASRSKQYKRDLTSTKTKFTFHWSRRLIPKEAVHPISPKIAGKLSALKNRKMMKKNQSKNEKGCRMVLGTKIRDWGI